MRILILTLIFLSILYPCVAQKEGDTWVFGDSASIQFINGNPVTLPGTNIYSIEATASISDNNGNLMFYAGSNVSSGYYTFSVLNRYHQVIQNGNNIKGHFSTSQGCLLLPFPNDTNKTYLFSHKLDAANYDFKIYYSVIDKSMNSDSGAVLIKNQPLPLINNMSEHMQAVRHGNGIDWWLITHAGSGNDFYIYLIDSYGISNPAIQSMGSSFPYFSAAGQMKISKDGSKLILVSTFGVIDLFDFDRCTGLLINWIILGNFTNYLSNYGCSFSPNSRFLYVSDYDTALYQFDLYAANILSSKQLIWLKPDTSGSGIGQHLLATDGKIYIANIKPINLVPNVFNLENMNLSVINSPDSLGLACDFQPYSFNLGGRRTFGGLPNIPDYTLGAMEPPCVVSVGEVEGKSKIDVYPNPASDVVSVSVNKLNSDFYLELTDIFGRKLLKTEFTNQREINVSHLAPGIYCLILDNIKTGERFMQKIVKK
jgi:hypothetical protein